MSVGVCNLILKLNVWNIAAKILKHLIGQGLFNHNFNTKPRSILPTPQIRKMYFKF